MENVLEYQLAYDVSGNELIGSKNYLLHLSANKPSCNFWSIVVYNKTDDLIIQTDQSWPSIHSNLSTLVLNKDGSVDTYFGPKEPLVKERNWIRTLPRKKWYAIVRLYDPIRHLSGEFWKPDDIVPIY